MTTMLRWLAIPPAIVAAWVLAILLGFGLRDVAVRFCPAEDMVSGMCIASWYQYVERSIIVGCAAIAAALILAVSVVLAPSHRVTVATVVLSGGLAAAFYMAYMSGAWDSFCGAVLAGFIAWFAMQRWAKMPAKWPEVL
ncbi:MAG: hypothetical protein WBK51_13705 [Polaromonas sp.]